MQDPACVCVDVVRIEVIAGGVRCIGCSGVRCIGVRCAGGRTRSGDSRESQVIVECFSIHDTRVFLNTPKGCVPHDIIGLCA